MDIQNGIFDNFCVNLARWKEDFTYTIEEYFESYIESAEEQNNFDWKSLKEFYNIHKKELGNIYSLRIYVESAFKLFVAFNCEQENLIVKIVRLYQKMIAEYTELAICPYCKQEDEFPKHYVYEEFISSRSILKTVNNLTIDEYKFTNRDYYAKLTVGSVVVADYIFLRFSVKYGLSYQPDDILEQARVHFGTLYTSYVILNRVARTDLQKEKAQFADSILNRLLESDKNPNWRRINLILLAIDFSLCKLMGELDYADYAKCLNLYASTLPEAEISMRDVEEILHFTFPNEDFINEAYSSFKEVFPDTPSLPSPRSLKHLCRCKVRDCIQKCPSLETVLSKVLIPIPLKEYLLYKSV